MLHDINLWLKCIETFGFDEAATRRKDEIKPMRVNLYEVVVFAYLTVG